MNREPTQILQLSALLPPSTVYAKHQPPYHHPTYFDAFSNMFLYLQILVALLIILLVKWVVERRRQLQLLQNLGYKVPPVNLVGGNLIELFTR